jgi:hypothetical protein
MALAGNRLRLIVGAAGIISVAAGMTIRAWQAGSLQEGLAVAVDLAVFIAIGAGPFVLYLLFIRSELLSTLTGIALLLSTAVVYAIVFGSDDPTAGLAFISVIPINYAISITGMGVEIWRLRAARNR